MLVLRYLWASPNTLLGLVCAGVACLTGGRVRLVAGVVEAHGGLVAWGLRRLVPLKGGAAALTLGHVVLGRDADMLDATRTHERVHVRQYERWGPFFLPAYAAASLWAAARGRPAYLANAFEREAYAVERLHGHDPRA
ncbi:MAG TPA: hypothetical protein VD948_02595 [Rhodothermales bacterium]|nr:hypothetical protein [Rhodothermales bacterium]